MYLKNCEIIDQGDGTAIVRGPCLLTGKLHETPPLCMALLELYEFGPFKAQDLFPDMDPPEREFLISGCSPAGWRSHVLGIEEPEEGEKKE